LLAPAIFAQVAVANFAPPPPPVAAKLSTVTPQGAGLLLTVPQSSTTRRSRSSPNESASGPSSEVAGRAVPPWVLAQPFSRAFACPVTLTKLSATLGMVTGTVNVPLLEVTLMVAFAFGCVTSSQCLSDGRSRKTPGSGVAGGGGKSPAGKLHV